MLTNATGSCTRQLKPNNKMKRVSAWGAGLWAVCQVCQAAQTSIPRVKGQENSFGKGLEAEGGNDLSDEVTTVSSVQGLLTGGCHQSNAGGLSPTGQCSQPGGRPHRGCPASRAYREVLSGCKPFQEEQPLRFSENSDLEMQDQAGLQSPCS